MPQRWKTVRIFISSTFRDMHAERDHLVRFVFPELKEKCRKNHVHLIDVDLRWGVTEADAQDGKALDICLDEIDSCRPYFLGLLGHRYGWVPSGEEHSITAQEIYHGVLHNEIPKQVIDLRRIIDGKLEGKALTQEQINCLVRCYPWDADKGKYLLREDASDDELEIIRAVFMQYSVYQRDRSFFFFRSENFTKKLAGAEVEDYFESDKTTQGKLVALKQEIIDEGLPWSEYDDIEAFGEKVRETLWQRIEAELGEKIEEEKDWLEEEAEFHEFFMADRTRRFVGRRDVLDRMHGFCEQDGDPSVMVITGEPGCGKSALVARFTEEITQQHPDWVIIPHFVGASPTSTNLRQTLRRLCTQLSRIIESPEEVPEDIKELIQVFPELLTKAAEQKRVFIILDALNQFEKTDNAHAVRWLPQGLHENVRFVVSTLAGEAFDALKNRRLTPKVDEVTGLDENEIRELVADYLKEIRHEFPNKQVEDAFFHKVKAGNPLYIQVALEELRVFGKFEKLSDRVEQLPDTVAALFDQVLERIESDFNPELVGDCMAFIACGRQGMTAEELQALLSAHAPQVEAGVQPEKLPDMLWARLYRAFGAYIFKRSGVIDFFHGQLKEAVGKRYLEEEADRNAVHKVIADYFENRWREPYYRALDELPHQRTKSEEWAALERILTDLEFIEGKFSAGMKYDLVLDYDRLDVGRLKPGPPIRTACLYKRKLGVQCPFCLSWNECTFESLGNVDNCLSCDNQLSINTFTLPKKWSISTGRSERKPAGKKAILVLSHAVEEFADFVRNQLHILSQLPELTLQQAHNWPDGSAPNLAASALCKLKPQIRPWLRWINKPQYMDPCLATLTGHSEEIHSCAYSPDGRSIVSASKDGTVKVWEMKSGAELVTLVGHEREKCLDERKKYVRSVSHHMPSAALLLYKPPNIFDARYSPDGRLIVSASEDKTLKLWDVKTGAEIATLIGHTGPVNACTYSPRGGQIVSASKDKTLKLWDVKTGAEIATFIGHTGSVNACAYAPDGGQIVSASSDGTIKLWDASTGLEIAMFSGHKDLVMACDYSPDGAQIVSASSDGTLKLWDVKTWAEIVTLSGHEGPVRACAYAPDGRFIVSGSWDNTLKLWDVDKGIEVATLQHSTRDHVNACSYSPDGRHIASASKDNTVKIWEPKSKSSVRLLASHEEDITFCKYSPDGRFVASASMDGLLKLWDAQNGSEITWLKRPDLKRDANIQNLNACAFSPDCQHIALGSINGKLTVWDTKKEVEIATLGSGNLAACSYAPDGWNLVAASSTALKIWDIESKSVVGILTEFEPSYEPSGGPTISDCAYSPDGRRIASALSDGNLKLWDVKNGSEIATLQHSTRFNHVNACSYSPDGRLIVSASDDKTLKLWDAKTRAEIATFSGHSRPVAACAYTQDGRYIISGSWDRTLKIWRADDGTEITTFQMDNRVRSLDSSPDGMSFFVGDMSGAVYLLRLEGIDCAIPLVTPVYLRQSDKGKWDPEPTAICCWCGQRFKPALTILEAIHSFIDYLNPDQSPCTDLPAEAWEEPRLQYECPCCRNQLRFNPFIVDNRGDSLNEAKKRYRFKAGRIPQQRRERPSQLSHRVGVARSPLFRSTAYHGKIGSNAPCPCGSGKKYKKCCGASIFKVTGEETIPHPTADSERGSRLNIEYQKELQKWKALPWWKRRKEKKPKPPTGI